MGTALKSVTAHLLTEFWLQNMRGMLIVALNGGIIQNEAFSHLTLQFNRFI